MGLSPRSGIIILTSTPRATHRPNADMMPELGTKYGLEIHSLFRAAKIISNKYRTARSLLSVGPVSSTKARAKPVAASAFLTSSLVPVASSQSLRNIAATSLTATPSILS